MGRRRFHGQPARGTGRHSIGNQRAPRSRKLRQFLSCCGLLGLCGRSSLSYGRADLSVAALDAVTQELRRRGRSTLAFLLPRWSVSILPQGGNSLRKLPPGCIGFGVQQEEKCVNCHGQTKLSRRRPPYRRQSARGRPFAPGTSARPRHRSCLRQCYRK